MLEFREKKKLKKFIYSPVILILLALILALLIKGLYGVYKKETVSADNLAREQGELSKLSAREDDLKQSIGYLKTDQGVEAEIRSKFRLVKDGESVAVIVGDDATNTNMSETNTATVATQSFWGKVWRWIGL